MGESFIDIVCTPGCVTDAEITQRRLPFYLAFESHDVSNDQKMMIECMKMIVQDIFRATAEAWETLLDICYTHVNILVRIPANFPCLLTSNGRLIYRKTK